MFDKSKQYSYTAQKHQRHRLLKIFLVFLILYVVYNCLTAFFFSVWVVENDTMKNGLNAGDRLIFTSFLTSPQNRELRRGSIVLVDKGGNKDQKWPLKVVDGIVRFFTAQRVSIFSRDGQYYIKRVIALPGDEISMTDYVFRVRPQGSTFSLTEFELSYKPYSPVIPRVSALWDDSLPFSGTMDTIILGEDECFVIADDRGTTNDSRTWGPISPSLITAKAAIRIWPLNKIERF
jgi:signal peptidase I